MIDITALRKRLNNADISDRERSVIAERLSNRIANMKKNQGTQPGQPIAAEAAVAAQAESKGEETKPAEKLPEEVDAFGRRSLAKV